MKSFITMFAALFFTAYSFATPPGSSRLSIINTENKNLRIIIDGNRYDGIGNNLSLANISMGYHNIRIYQIKRGFFSGDRLLYSSSIFLKPDRQLSLIVRHDGDVVINEQSGRWDNNRYPDRNDRDRDDRYGRNDRDDNHGRDNNSGKDNGYGRNDDRRNNNYPKF